MSKGVYCVDGRYHGGTLKSQLEERHVWNIGSLCSVYRDVYQNVVTTTVITTMGAFLWVMYWIGMEKLLKII